MYRLLSFVVCFIALIVATVSVPFYTSCKPNDGECLKKSAIAALPAFVAGRDDMGLPAADPLYIDKAEAGDKNFKLSFTDMKITGFSKCQIIDFSRNLDESSMTMVTQCPITSSGQYALSGKILLLPAEGNGGFLIETDKTQIATTVYVKEIEKAGEKHWKITKFDYKYDVLGKASMNLENLFGGDEALAKPFQEAMQNSAKEIINEVGGDIIEQIVKKVMKHIQKFLDHESISKLELS